MDLNSYDHFSKVPDVAIERSRFSKPYDHKTTFDAGQLVPFYIEDCLPASTYQISTAMAVRMATPIFPVMDNCYLDFYYFFVPYRILWDHWLEFMGENRSGYWTQQTDYYVPQLTASGSGFKAGSVADHFGFPTGVAGIKVSQFPFRAYCMIWNEWFRNENTDNPTYIITSDADLSSGAGFTALYGDNLLNVCREHDYFSDALPQPQKMEPVTIPIAGNAIVKTSLNPSNSEDLTTNPLLFRIPNSSAVSSMGSYPMYSSVVPSSGSGQPYVRVDSGAASGQMLSVIPSNLYADLSGVTAATINDLRMAFATQRYAERLAYGGSRYTEQLNTFYGLTTQDSRLQRPEFLGSDRVTINMSQVLQTSSTNDVSPQGNTAAFSLTVGSGKAPITYSTQEHGIIMGLCCVRHSRTYQQGINREWSRRELFDFYQPTFAHLGNQAILNKEIYAQGPTGGSDNGVFGYQEAWGEYRYKPSHVTGEFRSNYSKSLDPWHYADYYKNLPTLSSGWMAEGKDEIARTLAVKTQNQFIADFHVSTIVTAPMPLYSVPGLLDHF